MKKIFNVKLFLFKKKVTLHATHLYNNMEIIENALKIT